MARNLPFEFSGEMTSEKVEQLTTVLRIIFEELGAVTSGAHASDHENGGDDEIDVTGLSGLLADAQTPLAHDVLSVKHGDTTAAAVQRGDLITGQGASPTWTRLAKGAASTVLKSDGTDLSYATIVNAMVDAAAAIAWSKIDKTGSSLADLTTKSAAALTSGSLADARRANPVEETTTSTGTVNDYDLDGKFTVLRCNNATNLTITGFTVLGTTPSAGDMVIIESIGAGHVFFSHQTGSTAANRLINYSTSGTTPLAAGKGTATYVYDGTTGRWRLVQHEQGTWIAVAYASVTFSATGSLVWTVDAGDFVAYNYKLSGNLLTISWAFNSTATSGTADFGLLFTLPSTYVIGSAYGNLTGTGLRVNQAGTESLGNADLIATVSTVRCRTATFGNWALGALTLQGQLSFMVD